MEVHILLVGNGKMAAAVSQACQDQDISYSRLGDDLDYTHPEEKVVAIHFGSGRQLPELIKLCDQVGVPIIQGSTKIKKLEPIGNVGIINAPNLSLPMIRFMSVFEGFAKSIMPGMSLRIFESHQLGKADISGTAREIAKKLDYQESSIQFIRDRTSQLAYGVPDEYLDGHAYHDFIFQGQGAVIKVSTRIHGRATYAAGALMVARAIANSPTHWQGYYELTDILDRLFPSQCRSPALEMVRLFI